ncbi:MAG: Response regulator containing a CheY-like receiver domain and a GGDEF domain [Phormidium sp. OSCR]|nr:MAG: Response regulator containing a CheY-like receiver domain and a GGDEF domain [Phormidium sp. OSCR]
MPLIPAPPLLMASPVPFSSQELANLNPDDLRQLIHCFLSFNSNPLDNIHRLVNLGRELTGSLCACYQSRFQTEWVERSQQGSLTCIMDNASQSNCSRRQLNRSENTSSLNLLRCPTCQCQQNGVSQNWVITDDIHGKLSMRHSPGRPFNSEQRRIISLITRAIAIEEDRLYEQERQRIQQERELVVSQIAQQIRKSLDLQDILHNTVRSLLDFLEADRVIICRINDDGKGDILEEARNPEIPSMVDWVLSDPWLVDQKCHQDYLSGQVLVIEDMQQANLDPGLQQLMDFFKVRARLVMPIILTQEVEANAGDDTPSSGEAWGLLMVHQCHHPRQWQIDEINLLPQLATQLVIAIQQAQLYEQVQIANRELSELATQDGLTQICNRRRFDEYLDHEWGRLLRSQAPLSLILLDIDWFKQYNDTYGHLAGDQCLQQVAQSLKQSMQRSTDLVARYGGEEFAIILPDTTEAGAQFLAEQVRSQIAHMPIWDLGSHGNGSMSSQVTVSIGVASHIPFPEASPKLLVAAADLALYRAKEQGRNRVCIATDADFNQAE